MINPIVRLKITMFYTQHGMHSLDVPYQNLTAYYDIINVILAEPSTARALEQYRK